MPVVAIRWRSPDLTVTTFDWKLLGVTVCSVWLLMDLCRFIVFRLGSRFRKATERWEFQFGTSVAIVLAFFASTTVAAIFNAQPLVLPIVASVFVSFVTSGMGVAYAAILLTRALGWIVRQVRPVHLRPAQPRHAGRW
jgi:hypothetical protein